jgi:hypothetical protein
MKEKRMTRIFEDKTNPWGSRGGGIAVAVLHYQALF